jgi:hypothetical protein
MEDKGPPIRLSPEARNLRPILLTGVRNVARRMEKTTPGKARAEVMGEKVEKIGKVPKTSVKAYKRTAEIITEIAKLSGSTQQDVLERAIRFFEDELGALMARRQRDILEAQRDRQ